jgi:hypothetical protein
MDAGGAPPSIGTPSAEFEIDSAFVSGLLADQHPDLAHLPLRVVDAGWAAPPGTAAVAAGAGALPHRYTGARISVALECVALAAGDAG